ncbi:NADH-quinone oxidoreductase subunit NuoE [Solwaraspora sp. WMMD406]|uniref:NADH-quinone oxidoreductase subunit NuoE n=1 Tax=Solwaraspora sp. WMMD406 TaxID=3016095 RepID=UPI002415A854|nr:NADH-quinone oxidoreductase subunit NuoE [Solwaraspora sp. WMMD406]MDG4763351.1 NADH-quinone oxidoreductase subunit NuoE [Solwaraspora sp. WMMD406]
MMGFSQETHDRAREIISRYPADRSRSALLPLLHLVQSEDGYVSPAGVEFCAEQLGINKAQVSAVATFYTMYKRRPSGDWLVSVCTNTMCDVLGGQRVYDTLSEHLGVGHQETTADGTITLEHAECLAACDYGPVMTVNYDFFDKVDPDVALGVVSELRAGGRPAPTRGARLCTLKEMSLQLAGFADTREGAVADGPAGDATLRGLRLAQRHGIAVAGFDPNTPITGEAPAPDVSRPSPAATGSTAPDVKAPQTKSPEIRAAETRAPDAETPAPDAPGTTVPTDRAEPDSDAEAAESAGTAANPPAGDAKPAGDSPQPQREALRDARSEEGTA